MSRYTGPICRKCRRLGQSVCYTEKCALHRRPTPPGPVSGRTKQLSEYGRQLREKQKARITYDVTERVMRNYAAEAKRTAGATAENLLIELERRLDTAVFRAGLAQTQRQARQMTSHGHFLVNGKKVDVPSYKVNEGDTIELRPRLQNSILYTATKQEMKPPRWLVVDRGQYRVTVQSLPTSEDIDRTAIDSTLIIEYYSR